jgi:hypothetical protein
MEITLDDAPFELARVDKLVEAASEEDALALGEPLRLADVCPPLGLALDHLPVLGVSFGLDGCELVPELRELGREKPRLGEEVIVARELALHLH